jgi:2-polyprenyl-3-methyl-5-hydroxy-6-metoxy-1,4-benzoquinol methylase
MTRPGDHEAEEPRYDIEVDLSKKNTSQTQIVLLAGRDKDVLEVGPATGYVAKALRDRGCRVTGIEVDEEAAEVASQFCERMIVADVEDLDLEGVFPQQRFDVVIFGDVLEHLVDPEAVLIRTARVLAPGGYVVASIPNVTHGSVRLSLMTGQFRYTDTGLLDRTHLRFFDRQGIEEMFEATGYRIPEWREVRLKLFQPPEFELREEDVSPELIKSIEGAPDSQTYQYVFRAELVDIPEEAPPPRKPIGVSEIRPPERSESDETAELEAQLAET